MKKRLLIICLAMATTIIATAQNLIKDGGFDSGILEQNTGETESPTAGATKGTWYYRTHDNTIASIEDAGGERGNVVAIERTGSLSWFTSYIAQWIDGTATRDYYKLTFKAKLEKGTGKLRTHIKTAGAQQFFILKDGENLSYAAQYDVTLTNEWATYEIEYDFNTS